MGNYAENSSKECCMVYDILFSPGILPVHPSGSCLALGNVPIGNQPKRNTYLVCSALYFISGFLMLVSVLRNSETFFIHLDSWHCVQADPFDPGRGYSQPSRECGEDGLNFEGLAVARGAA